VLGDLNTCLSSKNLAIFVPTYFVSVTLLYCIKVA